MLPTQAGFVLQRPITIVGQAIETEVYATDLLRGTGTKVLESSLAKPMALRDVACSNEKSAIGECFFKYQTIPLVEG